MNNDLFEKNRNFADEMTSKGIDITEVSLFHPVSGAFNRPFIDAFWPMAIKNAMRRHADVTVVFIDLDNLKLVNDTQSHSAGDAMIRLFGEVVKAELRPEDYFFSIGGDEFLLVLVGANERQARSVIERIRIQCIVKSNEIKVRFSAGFYTLDKTFSETWQSASACADKRMYSNKTARKALKSMVG